jgi:hypothetical protein
MNNVCVIDNGSKQANWLSIGSNFLLYANGILKLMKLNAARGRCDKRI